MFRTRPQLVGAGMTYVEDFSAGTVKTIGALEFLAGLGVDLAGGPRRRSVGAAGAVPALSRPQSPSGAGSWIPEPGGNPT